jgi:hypothetical protein
MKLPQQQNQAAVKLLPINARKRQLLRDGYKAMAKEHSDFAKLSEDAAKEALPEWKE